MHIFLNTVTALLYSLWLKRKIFFIFRGKWTDNTSAVKWLTQVVEHLGGFQNSR